MNKLKIFNHKPYKRHEPVVRYFPLVRDGSFWFVVKFLILFISINSYAQQNTEASRRDVIQFGTETEIAALIQSLRTENADYLDNELIELAQTSRNQRILSGVFGFFGEREKSGLEARAIRIINDRDGEANETVLSAIEYLGRVKSADAVQVIINLLDSEERRFYNTGFRALGRAGSANRRVANEAADFMMDFYTNRNPGSDNQREIIVAIGTTGSVRGIEFLSNIATNDDERIPLRMAALEALSRIGDNGGLDAILSCVHSNDPNVRSAAVGALGPFSAWEVDDAILDGLRDSFYRTRIAAAQACRDRRLASAVPFLRFRAERDDVPNVRDEAIRALGAIANAEANEALESLFFERRNTDRVRILAADMLMKNEPDRNFEKLLIELDEAKRRNQNNLYNGLLKAVGETIMEGDKTGIANITRRFIQTGTVIEKLYALDMIANNNLTGFESELNTLSEDRNEGIARKARRTIEILEEYSTGRRQIRTNRREQVAVNNRPIDSEQETESNQTSDLEQITEGSETSDLEEQPESNLATNPRFDDSEQIEENSEEQSDNDE